MNEYFPNYYNHMEEFLVAQNQEHNIITNTVIIVKTWYDSNALKLKVSYLLRQVS